ncbi:hypothetical protein GNP73_19845 [Aliivibrio fischeri]|uniref:hypothetical protein n=1 Tax=Aliivibrio fischeri TaxID=668 RepID=UPI0012DAA92B|nr:hypothetical protein [Aliivibrio fischeri]MUJ30205.1 hypothetical protein [Aliivibrio fischeri]
MGDVFEKIFGGILVIGAIALASFSLTQGTLSKVEAIKTSAETKEVSELQQKNYKELTLKLNNIEERLSRISELNTAEKEIIFTKTGMSKIEEQNKQVMSLMKIIQDDPSKVFEFKDLKIRQETDIKILSERIVSLEKINNINVATLTDKLETAKYYNNILVGIVVLMLGVVWRQTIQVRREHDSLLKLKAEAVQE